MLNKERLSVPSLLVEFRKRLTDDVLCEINEMIAAFNALDDDLPEGGTGSCGTNEESSEQENKANNTMECI